MDIRPIGFAVWIASVVAVAACSPRTDERAADLDTSVAQAAAARAAAARQQQDRQRQQFAGSGGDASAANGTRAQPGSDLDSLLGGAPAAGASAARDARITAQVKAELAAARDLSGARIDIDTRDGVVTLSGPVRSAAVKARASEIARTVPEVRDVNDQLTLVMS